MMMKTNNNNPTQAELHFVYCTNAFGIRVKKCCASCRYRDVNRTVSTRYCTQHQRVVKAKNVCSLWQMSDGLQHAGCSLGVVRNRYTKEILF